MARIERLRVYPVKGFDGVGVEESRVTGAGTLAGDREWALCPPDAPPVVERGDAVEWAINGKQSEQIHTVETSFDPPATLTVDGESYDVGDAPGRAAAGEALTAGLDVDGPLELRRRDPPGFVDRPDAGPTVVSSATLREVASWFDDHGLSAAAVRRRLRVNVEVSGVPAFWEDRFVGEDAPVFRAGGVEFVGVESCARCVVPSRDPDTGEPLPEFRERFAERRGATFPDFADRDAVPHDYTLTLVAGVASGGGETVRVGDEVTTGHS
ncbi:MAG: Fe-S protein [uncultured archaeon A07HB70]|nr:MAG: Fe-S protein [uncultured archaeon A07HB70]